MDRQAHPFGELFADLRERWDQYSDHPSVFALRWFVYGYEQSIELMALAKIRATRAMAARLRATPSMDCFTIAAIHHRTEAEAHFAVLDELETAAREITGKEPEFREGGLGWAPVIRRFDDYLAMLADAAARGGQMRHAWELRANLEGFVRGLRDAGEDVRDWRDAIDGFERDVQRKWNATAPWDRLLAMLTTERTVEGAFLARYRVYRDGFDRQRRG